MAKVGAQRAAELTGRSKSTVQRAMNSGKLSFEIDANDRRVIDVSELDRVFGLRPQGSDNTAVEAELKKASDLIEAERLKMRIRMLEEQIDMTKEQMEDLREQRDQWQKQAQQVLLTSQYSQKQAEELKAEIKERDRKDEERRQMVMQSRMKKMPGQNQNQQPPQRPEQRRVEGQGMQRKPITDPAGAQQKPGAAAETPSENVFDIQGLWKKIKGRATA